MLNESLDTIIKDINEYGFVRIIPSINIDALLASGVLFKNLKEHGVEAIINLDTRYILEDIKEPLLLIDLPNIGENRYIHYIRYNNENSLTAYVTNYFDKTYGVDKWDKILSIIAGVYRGLDLGKEGFQGLEREFLDEFTKSHYIGLDLGFKFWGWRKYNVLKAMYRTLYPFIPGYSGDPHRVANMLKNVLKIEEPERVRGEQVFTEQDPDRAKKFLEYLDNTMEYLNPDIRKKLLLKLIGYIYTFNIGRYVFELHETLGALMIFSSIKEYYPRYIPLISINEEIVNQVMTIYNDLIDEISVVLSTSIKQYIASEQNIIETENLIRRPELLVDILNDIEALPKDKPLIISIEGEKHTCVRELLRLNYSLEKIYNYCNDTQLCRVDENDVLSKA